MDFFKIVERSKRGGEIEIFPDFQTGDVSDLLGRGKSFLAVWDEEKGLWSTNENDVQRIVDKEIWDHVEKLKNGREIDGYLNVKTLKSDSSGMWNRFVQYMRRFPDSKVQLDTKLNFANTKIRKSDYSSKRLDYALEDGPHEAWDKLLDTLYAPLERQKIEWAIGAVVAGDSKKIEKFFVLYGAPGKGKGTVLKIIKKLFDGYCVSFDAQSLGSSNDQFSMEVFRSNPLVAIDPDAKLNRIEDNTRLNTIVSHEEIVINEKGKQRYNMTLNCFLFIATNTPVKITDGASGIIRRLVDIYPSGKTLKPSEYESLMSRVQFELGGIAKHCLDVYRKLGKNYYNAYESKVMMLKTNAFYNFVEDEMSRLDCPEGISLIRAYDIYNDYVSKTNLEFKLSRPKFREELKNYYASFDERIRIGGEQLRSWYSGFLVDKFKPPVLGREEKPLSLVLDCKESLLDDILCNCPAQYAIDSGNGNEKPTSIWADVDTTLREIDTRKTHYVQPQKYDKNFVVVDFDLKNEKGEKDMTLNAEAASKWPPTYTEFSKGGCGIHLHYIYDGDLSTLNPVYAEGIEVKVFRGRAALRRRVSWCNNVPVAHLAVGALPLKEEKMIDVNVLKDEMHLRNLIKKCLRKGNHGATRPEIDLIAKALEEAHESGMSYDVRDLQHDILVFAMNSTHQSDYCVKCVNEMEMVSEDRREAEKEKGVLERDDPNSPLVIFDIEMYRPTEPGEVDSDGEENPGLFLICWKEFGEGKPIHDMINPNPHDVELFLQKKLGGFNNLGYDNPMLYYAMLGYNNAQLYEVSRRIISEKAKDAIPYESKNISYLDVFDLSSDKKGLKKWEIDLGISHVEMGIPWDEPAPRSMWKNIIEYCHNDVLATEAVLVNRKADLIAREILADLANGKVNDTTNTLTTKFIFGKDRHPVLVYTDLSTGERSDESRNDSIIGAFPGYKYVSALESEDGKRHNMFRGVDLGFGGYSYSEPGIYTDVALIDIQSMHPSSMVAMNYFGKYTQRFKDILDARIAIKNKDFEKARGMFDGSLAKYLEDEEQADGLAQALKIAINSCYGLTAASFENPMHDKRNVNNIVALRGALFMKTLLDELQSKGITVAHLKVDSMKIPNATPDILKFCMEFAKKYGYSFAHEATYDRMCLIDKAQYVAAYKDPEECRKMYGYVPSDNAKHFRKHSYPWTTTGDAFQHPYIFKTLFSGEEPEFKDMCETKSVRDAAIYLDMNEKLPDVSVYEKEFERRTWNSANPEKKPMRLNPELNDISDDEILKKVDAGHCYQFVGRVGSFFPVRKNSGGGILLAKRNGKYSSINGAKGYRWLEAEVAKELGKQDDYDREYFDKLVSDAIAAAGEFGDFDRFIDMSRPYEVSDLADDDPPWSDLPSVVPCGDGKYNTCLECPALKDDICMKGYEASVKHGGGIV